MPAVVFDVWLGPQEVGDLFLGARRDRLVDLQFRDARLTRGGDVLVWGVLVVGRHGESFGRRHPQRRAFGLEPTLWNVGTIGFGTYHYKYETGREGDGHTIGFYPRKGKLTNYLPIRQILWKAQSQP